MNRLGFRAVYQRRRIRIETKETRIGGRGRRKGLQHVPGNAQMRLPECVERLLRDGGIVIRQRVTFGEEAVVNNLWRVGA